MLRQHQLRRDGPAPQLGHAAEAIGQSGRADLTVAFPGFVRLTVRSIPWRDAQKCFEFLERSRIL